MTSTIQSTVWRIYQRVDIQQTILQIPNFNPDAAAREFNYCWEPRPITMMDGSILARANLLPSFGHLRDGASFSLARQHPKNRVHSESEDLPSLLPCLGI